MKVYWDTSAAINAMISPEVEARLDREHNFTRPHMFSEFFSIMTGRGIAITDDRGQIFDLVITGNDAAKWLRRFASKVSLIDLEGAEKLAALDNAESKRVSGQGVYD